MSSKHTVVLKNLFVEKDKPTFVDFKVPPGWIALNKLPKFLTIFKQDKVVPSYFEFSSLMYEGKPLYVELEFKPSSAPSTQP
jgi:hypothetical protein